VYEPGVDLHDWETEWEALAPLVVDSPAESLPELDHLVGRMLAARGLSREDEVAWEGVEPEIAAEYGEAHRVTRLVEAGEVVDPGDLGAAVAGYRNLYAALLAAHRGS
jgi:hypothetical protein